MPVTRAHERTHDRTHAPTRAHDREGGFTIIEVIVAAIVLSLAGAAIGAAYMGATGAQLASKLRNQQTAAASSLFASLRADGSWSIDRADCRNSYKSGVACDISALVQTDPVLVNQAQGIQLTVKATALGFDSPIDGVGTDDGDGELPDAYRLTLVISDGNPDSTLTPLTMSGTITAGIRASAGSLSVQVCSVLPQIDLRLTVGECDSSRSVPLAAPHGAPDSAAADWQAYLTAPAFARTVQVAPVTGTIVQIGPDKGNGTSATATTDSQGRATFEGIRPGSYRISTAPAGLERIDVQSRPADAVIEVTAGEDEDGLVVMGPSARHQVDIAAMIDELDFAWQVSASQSDAPLRLVPAPIGRAVDVVGRPNQHIPSSSGSGGGNGGGGPKGKAAGGNGGGNGGGGNGGGGGGGGPSIVPATSISFESVPPGLYIAYVMSDSSTPVLPLSNSQRYIWVGSDGTVVPANPVADEFTEGFCDIPAALLTTVDPSVTTLLSQGTELDPCDAPTLVSGSGGS